MVFLAVFAVFFGLGWLVGGSGVGGWGGREWVEWMDGGSGDVFFGEGRGGYGVGGRVVGGVEVLVLVLIVGGERGMFVSSG